ncbi:hypothetical protein Y1Q_0019805 [Alligator mississippiensis]|uniref:Uncharacterized protein n=1 Tax=Alligator mississippiensis TaxID=8496 RepID=A0A151PF42_ALLMI|nr:hypothetical protein Y1Q_0019805 [Alligator mississippiensis]
MSCCRCIEARRIDGTVGHPCKGCWNTSILRLLHVTRPKKAQCLWLPTNTMGDVATQNCISGTYTCPPDLRSCLFLNLEQLLDQREEIIHHLQKIATTIARTRVLITTQCGELLRITQEEHDLPVHHWWDVFKVP